VHDFMHEKKVFKTDWLWMYGALITLTLDVGLDPSSQAATSVDQHVLEGSVCLLQ
jgi:hypothetical protein